MECDCHKPCVYSILYTIQYHRYCDTVILYTVLLYTVILYTVILYTIDYK